MAGVVSDLGFDWRTSRAFILISRSAGLAAHIFEEMTEKPTWRIMPPSEYEIAYDEPYYEGPPERNFSR
jgi:citrate synthase